MTALPPALREKRWGPGQSGNPSGKGGLYHEMQRRAREFTPEATEYLIEIARDKSEDARNRIVAMSMLYDRAWGKPKDYDPNAEAAPSRFDPSRLTPEERDQVRKALGLIARSAVVAVPVEETEIGQ
jgi:hypothetical protein